MPLRGDGARRALAAIALAMTVVGPRVAATTQPPAAPGGNTPTVEDISRALAAVKADPNLAAERTIKTLQWKRPSQPAQPRNMRWLAWLLDFFGWVAQSTRVLVWVAAIVLAGLLVVYLVRVLGARGLPLHEPAFVAPTHVGNLDIRPEVLPRDIGAAARRQWDAGERRAAVALLYRGLLSRLVHVHRVPIRDSSTEGDCLTLAHAHLEADSREYTNRLVNAWQRLVYGGEAIESGVVYALCDGFSPALEVNARAAAGSSAP